MLRSLLGCALLLVVVTRCVHTSVPISCQWSIGCESIEPLAESKSVPSIDKPITLLSQSINGPFPPTIRAAGAATATTVFNATALRHLRGLQQSAGNPCFALPVDWSSERGQLQMNGRPFHLKGWCVRHGCVGARSGTRTRLPNPFRFHNTGSNWFGFETSVLFPHGLWGATTLDRVFRFMRENGFNALRVPFSAELALTPERVVQVEDPALNNLGNIARLARFVEVAARYDILVGG